MKEHDNSIRQGARDWDASGMPGMMPPTFQVTAGDTYAFGPKGENIWNTKSSLKVRPAEYNGAVINYDVKGGGVTQVPANDGIAKLGTTEGGATLETLSTAYIDQEKGAQIPIRDVFSYHLIGGKYVVAPENASGKEFDLNGQYKLKSELLKAGPESIVRNITLYEAPTKVVDKQASLNTSGSTTKGGIDVGAGGEAGQKSTLHVELDGNDVALIIDGVAKTVSKEEALSSDALESVLGGFESLLAKQKATADMDMQMRAKLESYFGYHWENTSKELSFHSEVSEFERGGVKAIDQQTVTLFQPDPEPEKNTYFEKDGQVAVSDIGKSGIAKFMADHADKFDGVKRGTHMITLSGHASSSGTEETNLKVSRERLEEIMRMICTSDNGIDHHEDFILENNGESKSFQGDVFDLDRKVKLSFVLRR
jgi:hypothetical protein